MGIPQPWVLSIDRTNWEFGDQVFNILMLGVVHNGVAFPLLWLMLDKKGNSNSEERIDLLDEFFEVFPEVEVAYLTGDREFLGQVWFEYLLETAQLEFRIRIRESDKLDDGCQSLKAKVVFSALQTNQQQVLRHRRQVWGHWVYISALRLEDGKLLIVMSNHRPHQAIADYGKRWGIETLFGCLKTYSPNLNLIERLWKFVKKQCLYSIYYPDFSTFKQAITDCHDQCHTTYKKELDSLLTLKFQSLKDVKSIP